MLLTLGIVGGTILNFGPASFTFLYEHFLGFITVTAGFSYITALLLHYSSYKGAKMAALGGNSGSFIYDVSLECCLTKCDN